MPPVIPTVAPLQPVAPRFESGTLDSGPLNETRNDPDVVPGVAVTVAKSPTFVKACNCVCTSEAASVVRHGGGRLALERELERTGRGGGVRRDNQGAGVEVTMPAAELNERMYDLPEVSARAVGDVDQAAAIDAGRIENTSPTHSAIGTPYRPAGFRWSLR